MHKILRIAAVALLFAHVVGRPATAAACTCFATPIATSEPKDNDTDVPPNEAIVVMGHLDPQSFELKDAHGAAVEIDVDHGPTGDHCVTTWAELRPKRPLAALTEYTVSVRPDLPPFDPAAPHSFSFTTGADLLPEPTLSAPKGRVSVIEGVPSGGETIGACLTKPVQACIGLDEGVALEIIARRAGNVIVRTLTVSSKVAFGIGELPDCLEFRSRALTGKRSEPLILCGDALAVRAYRDSDVEGGRGNTFLCHDGLFGPYDAGTAVVDAATSDAAPAPGPSTTNDAGAATTQSDDAAIAAPASTSVAGAARAPANDAGLDVSQSHVTDDDSTHSEVHTDGCALRPGARAPDSAWTALLLAIAVLWPRRRR